MSRHIEHAPETPGDAPVTPQWRSHLLISMPLAESAEVGPERPIRQERVPEEGHQRGR